MSAIASAALTVDAFCRQYGVGRTAFYEEVKAGRLKPVKLGRRTLIPTKEADRWLSELPAMAAAKSA